MRRPLLIVSAVLLSPLCAFAEAVPETFARAVRRAFDADAAWTMEKALPALKRPLRSAGSVTARIGKGFVWRTERPFTHEIRVTRDAMTFITETGTEVKPCDELPYYTEICDATDAFVAGEAKAFERLFAWSWDETVDGRWTMTLETRDSRLAKLFETVELSGGETLERAVMKTPSEGTLRIDFREKPREGGKEAPAE